MSKRKREFENSLRQVDSDTIEWSERIGFLTPTRHPQTPAEVFLITTSPIYGLGIHLRVDGRIEFYRRMLDWALRDEVTNDEIIATVMALAKEYDYDTAPPIVSLAIWCRAVQSALRDMRSRNITFAIDGRTLRFRLKEVG